MLVRLRHFVPLFALALGCYNASSSSPDGGSGRPDTGVDSGPMVFDGAPRPDTGPPPVPLDAGPTPVDAGPTPIDAGPTPIDAGPDFICTPMPADLLCDMRVGPGEAVDLPVAIDTCGCVDFVACDARFVGGTIQVDTQFCSNPAVDCFRCEPFSEGTCTLPPMPEGTFPIFVNGEFGGMLEVDEGPSVGPQCVSLAHQDNACGTDGTEESGRFDEMCTSYSAETQRVAIEVLANCASCIESAGTCTVTREGSRLFVDAQMEVGACRLGCPDICERRETTCWSPELPPGEYEVRLLDSRGGTQLLDTLRVGAANVEPQCIGGTDAL